MRGIKKVSTAGMSREDWLEQRRHTIGGSDAAGIIGLSKWSSPVSVWADKTGRLPDKPDTEAMRLGRDLEGYVARRWMEATGKKVRRLNAMLYNELYPFAHADIDREVIGERAGLECKTTSTLDVKQFQGVEFPVKYYVQCVHYLAVTGYDRWYLSVLVFGRGLFNFVLEGYLMNMKTTTGAYIYRDEMNSGKLLGFPYRVSNQITTDGTGLTELAFGNWSDLLVGEQLGLETYTTLDGSWTDEDGVQHNAFEENLAATRALMYVDIAARHKESFIHVKNIKAF